MGKDKKKTKKPKKDWRVVTLEWVEAIAVAVFLAMFVRYFLVEPFKIPTGSMQPTLWGERTRSDIYSTNEELQGRYPDRRRGGDKVLVNKLLYDFRKPERWDIIVFKYPENISTNYIKRLWGLPGETIEVRDGDVWINGKLARKPPKIQRVLWLRYFDQERLRRSPREASGQLREEILKLWPEKHYRHEFVDVVDGKLVLKADASPDPVELSYARPVRSASRDDRYSYIVGDLCLDFDVMAPSDKGTLFLKLSRNDNHFALRLPVDGGPVALEHNGRAVTLPEQPAGLAVNDGKKHHVEFSNADGAVRLFFDGRLVFEHAYHLEPVDEGFGQGSSAAGLGAAGARVALWRLRLRHDVYYTNPRHMYTNPKEVPGAGSSGFCGVGEPFRIPQRHYFFLGDNSANSADSRMWGAAPERYLLGEAFFIFRPILRWRFVN